MVARVRFWLLEMSRLIAKASFDVMILKSLFQCLDGSTRWEVDFSVVSGFVVDLEVELTSVLVNVKRLGVPGRGRGVESANRFKQFFSSDISL